MCFYYYKAFIPYHANHNLCFQISQEFGNFRYTLDILSTPGHLKFVTKLQHLFHLFMFYLYIIPIFLSLF